MSSKRLTDAQTSSPASTIPPLSLAKSRRGSLASISSRTVVDKEALSQALDQVHSNACRTESLTSFNDFAAPPSSAAPSDERGLAGQIASTGLSGIYSRLRASVGPSREPSSSPQSLQSGTSQQLSSRRPLTPSTLADGSPGPAATLPDYDEQPSLPGRQSQPNLNVLDKGRQSSSKAGSSLPFAETAKLIAEKDLPENDLRQTPQLLPIDSEIADDQSIAINTTAVGTSSDSALGNQKRLNVQDGNSLDTGRDAIPGDLSARFKSDEKREGAKKDSAPGITPNVNSEESVRRKQSQLPGLKLSRTSSSNTSELSGKNGLPLTSTLSDPVDARQDGRDKKRNTRQPSTAIVDQVKRKVLSRDFWMKDENAKVCFNCGEGFTTFRRKHHCRLCGQIYCASCTNLISGKPFGQASKLRVCKTCEVMINGDDSSDPDYSDDEDIKQTRFSDTLQEINLHHHGELAAGQRQSSDISLLNANGMRQPPLNRPSSSRSLKSLSGRPRSSSQRPRRSRHQHMRSLGILDGGAPFHKGASTQVTSDSSLPAFHIDSIIDPDLAPFLSDEGSSDEEQPSIATAMDSNVQESSTPPHQHESIFLKRGRPKSSSRSATDTTFLNKDADSSNLSSFRVGQLRRQGSTRTWSLGSLGRHASSPRVVRSENLFTEYSLPDKVSQTKGFDIDSPVSMDSTSTPYFTLSQRSGNPAAELNQASLAYVKKILGQFLTDYKVHNAIKWEKSLVPLFLRCAEEIDPNIQRGDDIDIRHYVKLKRAIGGSPKDSAYISGVVFTKNIALKNMSRHIENPRILLVSFPLIYGKKEAVLMSIDPVMAQEWEYLRNLVNRIIALKPTVLLAQREVSGLALKFLADANITVVKLVKPSVMQAVARCAQTRIITSMDKLTMDAKTLGVCQTFSVKTFAYENLKKHYIYISGCQKDLGCTIVLRGGDKTTLSRVKWITEFMCYVAYNLKLETCLLRDEFVSIPSSTVDDTQTDSDRSFQGTNASSLAIDHGAKTVPAENSGDRPAKESSEKTNTGSESADLIKILNNLRKNPSDKSAPLTYNKMVQELERRALSISPYVKLADPYLLLRGREQEKQMNHLIQLQRQDDLDDQSEIPGAQQQKFELIKPEMVYGDADHASPQIREALRAIHSAEYDKIFHRYTMLRRRWESYISGVIDPFSPLTHQRIVVLFSIISTQSADSCDGPDLLGLDFYQEHDIEQALEPDVPLGEYVERLCDQADSPCTAQRCEKKMIDHHRQYVHGDGQISIFVQRMKSKIRGLDNTILMWSCCKICDHETQVVPMSSNSWKYSFGKYLELSFWSDPMHPRAGACSHDIHRDHVRYFGFRNLAIRVDYEAINILEVITPRLRVMWKVEKDLVLKNSEYQNMEERIGRFFTSVKMRLKSINLSNITPGMQEACKAEIDSLLKRTMEDHDFVVGKLQEKYMSSKYFEIIPLNRAIRALQERVGDWNNIFMDFEKKYLPSEKELRKLATLQLKEAYLDQNESISSTELSEEHFDEKSVDVEKPADDDEKTDKRTLHTSSPTPTIQSQSPARQITDTAPMAIVPFSGPEHERQMVQSLDLALPGDSPGTTLLDDGLSGIRARNSLAKQDSQKEEKFSNSSTTEPKPLEQAVATKAEDLAKHSGGNSQEGRKPSPTSGIPKLANRRTGSASPPPLVRSKTQPVGLQHPISSLVSQHDSTAIASAGNNIKPASPLNQVRFPEAQQHVAQTTEKKPPEKLGTAAIGGKAVLQSMIPRSVPGNKQFSKVSSLAKHFEQLSREFEKQRLRERRQRAATDHQRRMYPVASSRPIVEVFRDAQEAVKEQESATEEMKLPDPPDLKQSEDLDIDKNSSVKTEEMNHVASLQSEQDRVKFEDSGNAGKNNDESYPTSLVETSNVDNEQPLDDTQDSGQTEEYSQPLPDMLSELNVEIPKHEKTSLMKMLTSFWSERSNIGWSQIEYPLLPTNHIFADSDVIVREDEPSSVVAWALASQDYQAKVHKFRERVKAGETGNQKVEGNPPDDDGDVERVLLGSTATHMKYQFQLGSTRLLCKIFYAESFDAIRRKCGVADRFVESLSRCLKWDSKGGKTKSLFLKTLDERFVLKSLSKVETDSFLKFAPDYFDYMSKCLFHNLPSALAKMLGFYQIVIKNPVTGIDFNYFIQVMENVFYEGPSNRMFDLKGSMRNRKIQSTGEKNEVLLDENLLDYISGAPVYVRNHSNSILAASISNDTLFCSKQNVMDYSLIVGLYDDRKELLVGIIDYIRTYTWDKKLESWIKDRGKYKPTVRSPKDYRNRFRASIPRYFPLAPSCWQLFGHQRLEYGKPILGAVDSQVLEDPAEEAVEVADPVVDADTGSH